MIVPNVPVIPAGQGGVFAPITERGRHLFKTGGNAIALVAHVALTLFCTLISTVTFQWIYCWSPRLDALRGRFWNATQLDAYHLAVNAWGVVSPSGAAEILAPPFVPPPPDAPQPLFPYTKQEVLAKLKWFMSDVLAKGSHDTSEKGCYAKAAIGGSLIGLSLIGRVTTLPTAIALSYFLATGAKKLGWKGTLTTLSAAATLHKITFVDTLAKWLLGVPAQINNAIPDPNKIVKDGLEANYPGAFAFLELLNTSAETFTSLAKLVSVVSAPIIKVTNFAVWTLPVSGSIAAVMAVHRNRGYIHWCLSNFIGTASIWRPIATNLFPIPDYGIPIGDHFVGPNGRILTDDQFVDAVISEGAKQGVMLPRPNVPQLGVVIEQGPNKWRFYVKQVNRLVINPLKWVKKVLTGPNVLSRRRLRVLTNLRNQGASESDLANYCRGWLDLNKMFLEVSSEPKDTDTEANKRLGWLQNSNRIKAEGNERRRIIDNLTIAGLARKAGFGPRGGGFSDDNKDRT